jgi:hypothetical protein
VIQQQSFALNSSKMIKRLQIFRSLVYAPLIYRNTVIRRTRLHDFIIDHLNDASLFQRGCIANMAPLVSYADLHFVNRNGGKIFKGGRLMLVKDCTFGDTSIFQTKEKTEAKAVHTT